jgi:hypothetical protein
LVQAVMKIENIEVMSPCYDKQRTQHEQIATDNTERSISEKERRITIEIALQGGHSKDAGEFNNGLAWTAVYGTKNR